MVTTRVHDANVLVDALWTPPSALFIVCSLPQLRTLPNLATIVVWTHLSPSQRSPTSVLAKASTGATRPAK